MGAYIVINLRLKLIRSFIVMFVQPIYFILKYVTHFDSIVPAVTFYIKLIERGYLGFSRDL